MQFSGVCSFLNIWSYSGDFHTRVVVMVSSVFWSLFTKRRNAYESCSNEEPMIIAEAAGDSRGLPFFDAVTWPWSLMDDDGMFTFPMGLGYNVYLDYYIDSCIYFLVDDKFSSIRLCS